VLEFINLAKDEPCALYDGNLQDTRCILILKYSAALWKAVCAVSGMILFSLDTPPFGRIQTHFRFRHAAFLVRFIPRAQACHEYGFCASAGRHACSTFGCVEERQDLPP
jgi:hypothetical protein